MGTTTTIITKIPAADYTDSAYATLLCIPQVDVRVAHIGYAPNAPIVADGDNTINLYVGATGDVASLLTDPTDLEGGGVASASGSISNSTSSISGATEVSTTPPEGEGPDPTGGIEAGNGALWVIEATGEVSDPGGIVTIVLEEVD